MKKKLVCLLALLSLQAQAAQTLTLVTEEYPPFSMTSPDGKIAGVSVEIVETLMKKADFASTITVYPWARALKMAELNADTCVFSVSRIPDREKLYAWIGPLVVNKWVLFANKNAGHHPKRLSDVKNAVIGTYIGDAIIPFLESRKIKVEIVNSDELNLSKLKLNRIDYWGTGQLIGQYYIKKNKVKDIEEALIFNQTEMYLGCNKQMDKAILKKLQNTLNSMRVREIKQIYKKHGYSP